MYVKLAKRRKMEKHSHYHSATSTQLAELALRRATRATAQGPKINKGNKYIILYI